jgi:hypothetical protein
MPNDIDIYLKKLDGPTAQTAFNSLRMLNARSDVRRKNSALLLWRNRAWETCEKPKRETWLRLFYEKSDVLINAPKQIDLLKASKDVKDIVMVMLMQRRPPQSRWNSMLPFLDPNIEEHRQIAHAALCKMEKENTYKNVSGSAWGWGVQQWKKWYTNEPEPELTQMFETLDVFKNGSLQKYTSLRSRLIADRSKLAPDQAEEERLQSILHDIASHNDFA